MEEEKEIIIYNGDRGEKFVNMLLNKIKNCSKLDDLKINHPTQTKLKVIIICMYLLIFLSQNFCIK